MMPFISVAIRHNYTETVTMGFQPSINYNVCGRDAGYKLHRHREQSSFFLRLIRAQPSSQIKHLARIEHERESCYECKKKKDAVCCLTGLNNPFISFSAVEESTLDKGKVF